MNRLPVPALEVFLAIAEQGSLRRAAEALGVQPPAISHQLKALEDQIGVAVFARTTRSVQLTDAGRALLKRAGPAMTELHEAIEDARGLGKTRSGTIKLSLPYVAYQAVIAPKLARFQASYPAIQLDLSFDEAFVDIVSGGFHAGVRLGDQIHEDMIAVRLGRPMKQVFFAAPSYLDRQGRPQRPEDLLQHSCIRYRYIASGRIAEWQFQGDRGLTTVDVKGGLTVNSTSAAIHAARDGLGISWLYRPNVEEDLKSGALEAVLDDFVVEQPGYFLYYPRANARIEILRVFIDFMKYRHRRARSPASK